MEDIAYQIVLCTDAVTLWRITTEKITSYEQLLPCLNVYIRKLLTQNYFLQKLLLIHALTLPEKGTLTFADFLVLWGASPAYEKMKPDARKSKYHLFQKDVPSEMRLDVWKSSRSNTLGFTTQKMLGKACKIGDLACIEYILESEYLWCSTLHMNVIRKHLCHDKEKCLAYNEKFLQCFDTISLKSIKDDINHNRHARGFPAQGPDTGGRARFGRDLFEKSTFVADKAYMQELAIEYNNMELYLNPELYTHCRSDSQPLTRRETILHCIHTSPRFLQLLECSKEELETVQRRRVDCLKYLPLVKYFRGMNVDLSKNYPLCSYVLEGKDVQPPPFTDKSVLHMHTEAHAYVHQRGGKIAQSKIDKLFMGLIRADEKYDTWEYLPEYIRYFYAFTFLENKRALVEEKCKHDPCMLQWLSTVN